MDSEQYDLICKARLDRIESIMVNINKKLFRGNGSPAFDVRLDRVERISKILVWLGALMTTTMFVIVGKIIYTAVSA